MSEWWTYRPSDFLLFAPRTYYRLIELYNTEIWPLQVGGVIVGILVLGLMLSRKPSGARLAVAMLAACWLWVAWAFHWQRYATINWSASYFAIGFAIEALLLTWIGVIRGRMQFDSLSSVRSRVGSAVFVFALIVEPLVGLLSGRSWLQLEVFGVGSDPTVVATLGLLMATRRVNWIAWAVPVLWCVVSGVTAATMDAADAFVLPGVAIVAILLRLALRQHGHALGNGVDLR